MNARFTPNPVLAWLLAAALLVVSATASAHELEHATAHHDAACALHLYSGHGGALPTLAHEPDLQLPRTVRIALPVFGILVSSRLPLPPARAPPLRS